MNSYVVHGFVVMAILSNFPQLPFQVPEPGDPERTAALKLIEKVDDLYDAYLKSPDPEEAKSILLRAAAATLESTQAPKKLIARYLLLIYSRLHVLADKVGDQDDADSYFVRAQYWYLIDQEVAGATIDEANRSLKKWTKQVAGSYVSNWDLRKTERKGPRYWAALRKNDPTEKRDGQ